MFPVHLSMREIPYSFYVQYDTFSIILLWLQTGSSFTLKRSSSLFLVRSFVRLFVCLYVCLFVCHTFCYIFCTGIRRLYTSASSIILSQTQSNILFIGQ
jgi:hypothetical protein